MATHTELPKRSTPRQLRADRRDDGLQLANDHLVETTIRNGRPRRIAGLVARHRGSKPTVLTPALEAHILTWTRRPPPHGAIHWSTRSLGQKLGVQHTIVARAWQHAGLQPHRLERYMLSTDPKFETMGADVIGLYLDPPQHAGVFCVDEKTAIQALDRLDPVLPLSPGRAERHGFEYLLARDAVALRGAQYADGRGRRAYRGTATSAEFVRFLQTVVDTPPRRREMHIIVDNLSAHKTQQFRSFLVAHPSVHLHYTPTYSSWLNQVQLWFSKIERDVTARGIFTSVTDLRRKLTRYIKHYNKTATPIRWSYADPSRRSV